MPIHEQLLATRRASQLRIDEMRKEEEKRALDGCRCALVEMISLSSTHCEENVVRFPHCCCRHIPSGYASDGLSSAFE